MASSNVDLRRESSICSISTIIADLQTADSSKNLVSMSMDDLLKNIYSDGQAQIQVQEEENPIVRAVEVGGSDQGITLEDFLSKAAGGVSGISEAGGYVVESGLDDRFRAAPSQQLEGVVIGVGRGKRRAVEEPVDKATQQRQKRMIKNRESAARSRERKQAYTLELEAIVTQLEEENAQLLREEAEHVKERYKQLMEKLIPISEKRRPKRVLRRANSFEW